MSKYYKVEDVIDTLAEQWHFEATIDYPYAADDIEEMNLVERGYAQMTIATMWQILQITQTDARTEK